MDLKYRYTPPQEAFPLRTCGNVVPGSLTQDLVQASYMMYCRITTPAGFENLNFGHSVPLQNHSFGEWIYSLAHSMNAAQWMSEGQRQIKPEAPHVCSRLPGRHWPTHPQMHCRAFPSAMTTRQNSALVISDSTELGWCWRMFHSCSA